MKVGMALGMEVRTVGVVGCGLMGSGIAQVCAEAGYEVLVREVSDELLKKGLGKIESFLKKGVEKGKVTPERMKEVLGRLRGTTALDELGSADIVIEAVVENLAVVTKRPDRFVGLHFFNPVPLMKLVEVVRSPLTSPESLERAFAFAKSLGKTPVKAGDKTGFIVNRLLVPYLLDAIRALEEGTGSVPDIDEAMKLGCGHPMGPFTLLDFVGLDTTYYIANIMFEEFREKRFAPPPLLKRMVQAGLHGKKTGKGFYDYSQEPPRPTAGLA
jgi:3-hydroxybutyryl-CoA dehydrogenase